MDIARFSLLVGWTSMIFGAISGAWIGLSFHVDAWAGGYASFRRRMLRLGHIAFFGLGFVNVLFALSLPALPAGRTPPVAAAGLLAAGALTMPPCCFLAAWRPSFRHLFPIPVVSTLGGLCLVVIGWVR